MPVGRQECPPLILLEGRLPKADPGQMEKNGHWVPNLKHWIPEDPREAEAFPHECSAGWSEQLRIPIGPLEPAPNYTTPAKEGGGEQTDEHARSS